MTEVISVRFRNGCKSYYFSPGDEKLRTGDNVVVDTAQGAEYGTVSIGNHFVPDETVVQPLRALIRTATEADRRVIENNAKREKDSFSVCEQKILAHKLDMKLVNVECSFEGNKMIFFFTADGRVDFRELVKDLAAAFHSRIELRQIGVRDESKMLGGLGICGRPFCCNGFLDEFQPVSIKMAKTQNLSLNPTKISGTCGRLMCCLKYEQHAYEDAQKRMCKCDSFVQTPDGPGNVTAVNLVKECVTVRLDESPESPKSYHGDEVVVLRNGKGSREGVDIPARPQRRVEEQTAEPKPHSDVSAYGYSSEHMADSHYAPAPRDGARRNEQRDGGAPRRNDRSRSGDRRPSGGQRPDNRQAKPDGRAQQRPSGDRRPAPDRKGAPAQDKKPAPDRRAQNAPRPSNDRRPSDAPTKIVRFASSIPMADNAATAAQPKDDAERRRRRPRPRRRPGGNGGNNGGGNAPDSAPKGE